MEIGERIKFLRTSMGKNREDVCKDLGIKVRALQTYETGECTPPTKTVIVLAKYFNVSTDYLLGVSHSATGGVSEKELQFSSNVINKLAEMFEKLPDSTKVNIINWLKDSIEIVNNEDEIEPIEEEPVLFIAASDGNPITEIDRGVIERLKNAPEIDPSEFDDI